MGHARKPGKVSRRIPERPASTRSHCLGTFAIGSDIVWRRTVTNDERECRDWRNQRFASAASFCREVYGHAITSQHSIGRVGAALLETEQTRGDWSDAATPDLVLSGHAKPSGMFPRRLILVREDFAPQ